MSNNPFKPPDTDLRGKPPPNSPVKAVLVGLAIDIGGSTLVGILLSIAYAATLVNTGLSEDELKEAVTHIPPDSVFSIAGTLLGAACSVLGGYVCARIVCRDEFRTGAVMASLSGFLGLTLGSSDTPDDLLFLLTLSTVACVMLGVKYGRERNQRGEVPPPAPPAPPEEASGP